MSRNALRRRWKTWPAIIVAVAVLCPAQAAAQPSIWDEAKNPDLAKAEHVLHAVERMLLRAQEARFDPDMQSDFTRSALAMLELAGGSALPSARMKYLLGDLLVDSSVGRYKEAEQLLRSTLRAAPDDPAAAQGWFDLAIAEAKLHKPKKEIEAYDRALERAWEPQLRATIFMNRGESRMVMGHLQPALADYRHAIQIAREPRLRALAYYGLGITLERSGDLPSALDAMHKANAIQVQIGATYGSALDLPTVFFVPPYDLFYYKALSNMAAARDAQKPSNKVVELERAISYWTRYLAGAGRDHTPWVRHAKLLRASCRRKLDKATVELANSRRKKEKKRAR